MPRYRAALHATATSSSVAAGQGRGCRGKIVGREQGAFGEARYNSGAIILFSNLISSDSVEIEAPIGRVWDVLLDFERYGVWNPFTTRVETDLAVGSPVDLHVTLGPLKLRQPVRIEAVECPGLLVWSAKMGARSLDSARLIRGGFDAMSRALKARAETESQTPGHAT